MADSPTCTDPAGLPALVEAIRHLHGAEATFIRAETVTVRLLGDVLWDGDVQVFDLPPGSPAPRAYAWSYPGKGTMRQFVAVLHSPHIESPTEAVRAYLVQASRKAKAEREGQ